MSGVGRSAWQLAFEISPVIFVNGIAANVPGGMLPVMLITEAFNFTAGLLGSAPNLDSLDDAFMHFEPLAGGTLIENEYGIYPFANQSVAANAVIVKPLIISLLAKCPAKNDGDMVTRLAIFTALQQAIQLHTNLGGSYVVATPSFFYNNCLLLSLKDVTTREGGSKQRQTAYQWDFFVPLLTQAQAISAQNSLMQKLTNGSEIDGAPSYSGANPTINVPPSLAALSVAPAAQASAAASIATPSGFLSGGSP